MVSMTQLRKGARITGSERAKLAGEIKKAYEKGKSIRYLADKYGRSYGWVHRMLVESDVTLRGRGGAMRKKAGSSKVQKGAASAVGSVALRASNA